MCAMFKLIHLQQLEYVYPLQSDPITQIAAIQGAVAIAGPDNCIMQVYTLLGY